MHFRNDFSRIPEETLIYDVYVGFSVNRKPVAEIVGDFSKIIFAFSEIIAYPFIGVRQIVGYYPLVFIVQVMIIRNYGYCVAPAGNPCRIVGNGYEKRRERRDSAVGQNVRPDQFEVVGEKLFAIGVEHCRITEHFGVARPAESFVALRAVGRNTYKIAFLPVRRHFIYAVYNIVGALETPAVNYILAYFFADYIGYRKFVFGPYLGVSESVKGKFGIENVVTARQNQLVGTFRPAKICGVKRSVVVKHFGKTNDNFSAARALCRKRNHSREILFEVKPYAVFAAVDRFGNYRIDNPNGFVKVWLSFKVEIAHFGFLPVRKFFARKIDFFAVEKVRAYYIRRIRIPRFVRFYRLRSGVFVFCRYFGAQAFFSPVDGVPDVITEIASVPAVGE